MHLVIVEKDSNAELCIKTASRVNLRQQYKKSQLVGTDMLEGKQQLPLRQTRP